MNDFLGSGCATLIGSMPQKDRKSTIDLVLRTAPEIPAWPQLARFAAEQMMEQYIEGLPGLVRTEERLFVDSASPEFDREVLVFYEQFLAVEDGRLKVEDSGFGLGERTGATFRAFMEAVEGASPAPRALKGQVVGPFTLLCGLKDQDGRALIYDERFLDIVPKLLGMKARWQIERMRTLGAPVIIFLDEPGLAGFGSSALITVSAELARRVLGEVVEAVHAAGGLAGVHVCANTDWRLAFDSNFDIINFDAYGYFDKFAIYKEECFDFFGRGGNIAWGVVPTSDPDAIDSETPESLAARWTGQAEAFAAGKMSLQELKEHSLFSPSCGCGSLSEARSERVLELLRGFCRIIGKQV
ncbi:MAG: hypothetical protein P4L43_09505 [Syntrophobacteraceae bacterium]|nr:hypothetical protein [Syntrophobacteraceae bacterium]